MTEFDQTLSKRPTEVDIGLDFSVRTLLRRGVNGHSDPQAWLSNSRSALHGDPSSWWSWLMG
jgi:hypothetical protein